MQPSGAAAVPSLPLQPAAPCQLLRAVTPPPPPSPPQVTLPLERFASRVAASLCTATGLGAEMVVGSQQEYEDRVRPWCGAVCSLFHRAVVL